MAQFQFPSSARFSETRNRTFAKETSDRLKTLCRRPATIVDSNNSTRVGLISDESIEEISNCLRDLEDEDACDRPRTFAVLHMMNRLDLMPIFKLAGRLDNSFPYPDRRSLPPLMRKDQEASHQFLELQSHVMSTACQMEKGIDSPHVLAESGDVFFQSLGLLGKGGDATVDKVRSKITKIVYARKRIHRQKDMNKDRGVLERFENELQILKKLDHNHLVKVFASYTDRKYVAIIMKPVAEIDLKDYLKQCGNTPLPQSRRARFRTYYGCLSSAVLYLHENRIRHKDIKPSNILLKGEDIYITDFGTAIEFDGDKSMTKGTVRTRTVQYQSPEVARGAKRGTASDIWSLGVTFLEMTTILRGESLAKMHLFLKNSGTLDEFVYENTSGAMQWTEYLRKNTKYPRIDNSPMQWIKDMLEQRATDRPTAMQLVDSIKQAAEGAFCGTCCKSEASEASEASDTSGLSSDSEEDDELTVRDNTVQPPAPVTTSTAKVTKIDHQSDEKRIVKPDPHQATLDPRKSRLHKQVFKAVSSYFPNVSFTNLYKNNTPTVVEDSEPNPPSHSSPDPSYAYDPYECNIPGSFPDFAPFDTIEGSTSWHVVEGDNRSLTLRNDTEQAVAHIDMPLPVTVAKTTSSTNAESMLLTSQSPDDTLRYSGSDPTQNSCNSIGAEVSPETDEVTLVDASFGLNSQRETTNSPEPINNNFVDLMPLLLQPSRRLKHSRSDEHLEIRNQTKSLLEDSFLEHVLEGPKLPMSERRASLSAAINESMEGQSRESITTDLRSWKMQLTCSPVLEDAIPSPDAPNEEEFCRVPLLTAINLEEVIPTSSVVTNKNYLQGVPPPTTVEDLPESYDPSIVEGWDAGPIFDSSVPSGYNATPVDVSPQPPSNPPETQSTNNTLKTWLSNSRSPPRLTGRNLEMHNLKTESKRPRPPPFSIKATSTYRKTVFDDTASSVPTSIMSARTRSKFKGFGLMLPLQDRTTDFLGTYTKEGKADAVRMLLKAGCNPGTKKDPRNAPIFNVVRGASSRHTKCLRSLVEYEVNVNVRSRRTGKTPLLEAVDQDDWSGYAKVIFLLIKANVDPNMADKAGDVPLLRLLGGGLAPLEESRRKALALLLSTPHINVGVTLPGTKNKPLHLAIRRSDPWAVGMLLEKNDSIIEAKNSEDLTPLLLTASLWTSEITPDKSKILDLLLEKGANVNARMPETRRTPLHIAISRGLVHVVERLLSHGADPKCRASDGKNAQDIRGERKKQHRCVDCSDCLTIEILLTPDS